MALAERHEIDAARNLADRLDLPIRLRELREFSCPEGL